MCVFVGKTFLSSFARMTFSVCAPYVRHWGKDGREGGMPRAREPARQPAEEMQGRLRGTTHGTEWRNERWLEKRRRRNGERDSAIVRRGRAVSVNTKWECEVEQRPFYSLADDWRIPLLRLDAVVVSYGQRRRKESGGGGGGP